jgi:uncharacterized membrane protein YjjP (DUF1212 family)
MSTENVTEHAQEHESHGHTPAAWTAVVIITLAFLIGMFAVIFGNWTVLYIAFGIAILGGIVGKVMAMMGMGAQPAE